MQWKAHISTHRGKEVIWVQFPNQQQYIQRFKKLVGAKWSATQKCWYLPNNDTYRQRFNLDTSYTPQLRGQCSASNMAEYKKMQDAITLLGYSPSTMRTYCVEFGALLQLLGNVRVQDLSHERLCAYFLYCHKTLKMSENAIHSRLNAIKFYFEKALKRPKIVWDIPRPKKPVLMPQVLSTADIKRILHRTDNLKHKVLLALCYGMGLRVSEIVALQLQHIDSKRMQVLIKAAKGKKDRYVALPETVLPLLRQYYKQFQPKKYLLEGQYGGQYATRSAQMVFKEALRRANINKQIGIHGLRHSYATHLHETGTDIALIKELLGHNQISTTLIYTHVANKQKLKVQSPLDKL
jgi:integrase/recombinase XerD